MGPGLLTDPPTDKAAQAAAQAAQAAAFQAQYQAHLQQQMQIPPSSQGVPAQTQQQQQQPSQQQTTPPTPAEALKLLEQWGLTGLIKGGGGMENVSHERQIAAALLNDVDGDRMASFNAFAPPIFGPRQTGNVSSSTSSFAPFSPDPAYGNDTPNANAAGQGGLTTANFPWYHLSSAGKEEGAASASGKVSPTSVPTMRAANAAQRYTSFLGEPPAPGSFQPPRTSSRQEAPIARPEPARRGSQKEEFGVGPAQEQDAIRDLNGTLASLALDDHEHVQTPSAAH